MPTDDVRVAAITLRRLAGGPSEKAAFWYQERPGVLRLCPPRREGAPHWIDDGEMRCAVCKRSLLELHATTPTPECDYGQ
jgi:hypothetical protein